MAKGNHSFSEREIHSRFGAIVGHTVAEVDTAGILAASSASRNKGRIGAVIEQSVLGYPADSDRRPDIVIDGQPWEVKATGLQYDAIPYRKWSSPLNLKEIGMDFLTPHEACTLQLGWELAGKDTNRDRNDMSVVELIELGEDEAENRDLVVWRYGYMDPYEGEIDTGRYSKEHIIEVCEGAGFDFNFSRRPEEEESLDDMAQAAESTLEENKENELQREHEEEIKF